MSKPKHLTFSRARGDSQRSWKGNGSRGRTGGTTDHESCVSASRSRQGSLCKQLRCDLLNHSGQHSKAKVTKCCILLQSSVSWHRGTDPSRLRSPTYPNLPDQLASKTQESGVFRVCLKAPDPRITRLNSHFKKQFPALATAKRSWGMQNKHALKAKRPEGKERDHMISWFFKNVSGFWGPE